MTKVHHVGIGQIAVSSTPGDRVEMIGLGSCIGTFLHDDKGWVAAAHSLLDQANGRSAQPGKFVDTAVPALLAEAKKAGIATSALKVSVAGGAQIFAFQGGRPELEIGQRNIETVKEVCKHHRLRIVVSDVGGTTPRRATMIVGEQKLTVLAQQGRKAA